MSTNRLLIVLAALVVAVAAFFLLPSRNGGDPSKEGSAASPGPSLELARATVTEAFTSPSEGQALPRESEIAEFRFQTTEGNPIGNVSVGIEPARGRFIRPTDLERIVSADPNGVARFSPPRAESLELRRVVARAHGFVPLDVTESATKPGKHDIVLRQAETLVVRCIDTVGRPVVGARVAVSRESFPHEESKLAEPEFENVLPAVHPRSALHVSHSGENGMVQFDALTPGRHGIWADAKGLFVASRPSIELPTSDEVVLVFNIAYAAILRVEGDRRVGGVAYVNDTSGKPMGDGFRSVAVDRIRKEFVERMPDSWPVLVLPTTAVKPVVRYRVLLEEAGLHEIPVEASPLVEPPIVTVVNAATLPRKGAPSADVFVRVVDGAGNPFETTAPWLVTYEPDGEPSKRRGPNDLHVNLMFGQTQRLPAGIYTVSSLSGSLSSRIRNKTFRVLPGDPQTIDIVIEGSWVPCRVKIDSDKDDPIPAVHVALTPSSGGTDWVLVENGEKEIRLPVGPGTVKLPASGGYFAGETPFLVPERPEGGVYEIVLRVHRTGK